MCKLKSAVMQQQYVLLSQVTQQLSKILCLPIYAQQFRSPLKEGKLIKECLFNLIAQLHKFYFTKFLLTDSNRNI